MPPPAALQPSSEGRSGVSFPGKSTAIPAILKHWRRRSVSDLRDVLCRRAATPELRQGETTECGLAALAIMLAHHGRPVPLERLRAEAGSTRLGVTARTLIQIARRHGMVARAFRKEPEGLAALGFPLIIHCRFIHFVVVEAATAEGLLVNDPACGPLVMGWDEVADSFTGIAITVQPPAFDVQAAPSGRRPPTPVRMLVQRLAPQRRLVAAIAGLAITMRVAAVAAAFAAGAWVDGRSGFLPLGSALAATVLAGWARDRATALLGGRLADATAAAAFDRLRRLPPGWFARRSGAQVLAAPLAGGTLQRRIGAVAGLAELPLPVLPLTAVLWIDVQAGAAVGLTLLAALAALSLVHGRRGGVVARLGAAAAVPLVPDEGTVAALGCHKAGGREGELIARLAGRHAGLTVVAQKAAAGHAGLTGLRAGLAGLGFGLALVLGLAGLAAGRLLPGEVLTLAALALAVHRPLGRLDRAGPALQSIKDALYRLDDAESATAGPDPSPVVLKSARPPAAGLSFEDAGFQPSPQAPPLLSGITLRLEPGERLAILGPSGSGKSVLAKLACGLLECSAGSISLAGEPVAAVAQRCPGAVVLVDRASPVTGGTVAGNLRAGDERLADASLVAALELVELWTDLEPRGGLSLALSRGGTELSGGQRRRLALARALLRDPVLLVIDEALDALEPALAARILDRLHRPDRILLVVGRRPETLEGCERHLLLGVAEAAS
ncbi:cysteine peptidase family C39 domain-containing protein [Azospirillum thiophilum]|uniref:cysteine peptidase family C39 domain-containing protein n=1 Tax=Azospirillum thiophilum TaxID=528244 RepID=UPI0009E47046|nr:cysteine peptidase family C39 domain-containing protein [Azospirillum thiophilum]